MMTRSAWPGWRHQAMQSACAAVSISSDVGGFSAGGELSGEVLFTDGREGVGGEGGPGRGSAVGRRRARGKSASRWRTSGPAW